ncbi:hypothetical protein AB4Y90_00250 [Chryseobacterium sp. 2TAF14]|uniref:hypothetical protein n=1 Tax=Chryseobacterium sp. 2TAF14 TaxID=3233007 RepID=UPI003F90FE31
MKKNIFYLSILLFCLQSCEVDKINDFQIENDKTKNYDEQAKFNLNTILTLSNSLNHSNLNTSSKNIPELNPKEITAYLVEERTLACGKTYVYVATTTDTSIYDRMVWITIKKGSTTIDNQYVIIPAGQSSNSLQFNRIYANVVKTFPINLATISVTNIIEFSPNAPNLTNDYIKHTYQQNIENCMTIGSNPEFCGGHGGDNNYNGICDDTDKLIKEFQELSNSVE